MIKSVQLYVHQLWLFISSLLLVRFSPTSFLHPFFGPSDNGCANEAHEVPEGLSKGIPKNPSKEIAETKKILSNNLEDFGGILANRNFTSRE